MRIQFISPDELYGIRSEVLRPGRPHEECKFEGDHDIDTFHLGAFHGDTLVSVATLKKEAHPDFQEGLQFRLRGMATLARHQGQGFGSALMRHAIEILRERGCERLWCNARLNAVDFYSGLGMRIRGEPFDIPSVGPHYVMHLIL